MNFTAIALLLVLSMAAIASIVSAKEYVCFISKGPHVDKWDSCEDCCYANGFSRKSAFWYNFYEHICECLYPKRPGFE